MDSPTPNDPYLTAIQWYHQLIYRTPTDIQDFHLLTISKPFEQFTPTTTSTTATDNLNPVEVTSLIATFVSELRVLGLHKDQPGLVTCTVSIQGESVADSGSNVCLTNNEHMLIDVVDILPDHVGLAVKDDTLNRSSCSRKGYLPMLLDDGTIHHQIFLVHDQASDTIISLERILFFEQTLSQLVPNWTQNQRDGIFPIL